MLFNFHPRCFECSTGRTGGVCTCNSRIARRSVDTVVKRRRV